MLCGSDCVGMHFRDNRAVICNWNNFPIQWWCSERIFVIHWIFGNSYFGVEWLLQLLRVCSVWIGRSTVDTVTVLLWKDQTGRGDLQSCRRIYNFSASDDVGAHIHEHHYHWILGLRLGHDRLSDGFGHLHIHLRRCVQLNQQLHWGQADLPLLLHLWQSLDQCSLRCHHHIRSRQCMLQMVLLSRSRCWTRLSHHEKLLYGLQIPLR